MESNGLKIKIFLSPQPSSFLCCIGVPSIMPRITQPFSLQNIGYLPNTITAQHWSRLKQFRLSNDPLGTWTHHAKVIVWKFRLRKKHWSCKLVMGILVQTTGSDEVNSWPINYCRRNYDLCFLGILRRKYKPWKA